MTPEERLAQAKTIYARYSNRNILLAEARLHANHSDLYVIIDRNIYHVTDYTFTDRSSKHAHLEIKLALTNQTPYTYYPMCVGDSFYQEELKVIFTDLGKAKEQVEKWRAKTVKSLKADLKQAENCVLRIKKKIADVESEETVIIEQ